MNTLVGCSCFYVFLLCGAFGLPIGLPVDFLLVFSTCVGHEVPWRLSYSINSTRGYFSFVLAVVYQRQPEASQWDVFPA